MEFNPQVFWWCVAWLLAAGGTVVVHWRRNRAGSGLVIGYLLSIGLLYLTGAAMFVFSAAEFVMSKEVILDGFRQCVYGTAAFAVGSIVLAPLISPKGSSPEASARSATKEQADKRPRYRWRTNPALVYLVVGVVSYPLLETFVGRLPSAQAIISRSQYLVLVGLCLYCWKFWRKENLFRFWVLVGITLLFPLVTIVTRGFAGYGIRAFLILAAFVATFYRPRWHMVAVGTVLVYVGLSFYVGYRAQRGELRDAVWGGREYEARWEQVSDMVNQSEAFTPTKLEHVSIVVGRLNLSYQTGIATEYVGTNQDYASGSTLYLATIAVIPRAVWPEKPAVAGSQDLVASYTGLTFAPGTSVGVGHVMEWYINFGTWGVVLGFLIFGTLITTIDNRASFYLERGNLPQFTLWFLPGTAFLNVGGQFADLTSSFIAGWIAVWGINTFLLPLFGVSPVTTASSSEIPTS